MCATSRILLITAHIKWNEMEIKMWLFQCKYMKTLASYIQKLIAWSHNASSNYAISFSTSERKENTDNSKAKCC